MTDEQLKPAPPPPPQPPSTPPPLIVLAADNAGTCTDGWCG